MDCNNDSISFEPNISYPENLTEKFLRVYPVNLWKLSYFNENYVRRINPFWMQFEPSSRFNHYLLGVIYILFLIVGLSGNLMVIFMFIKCKILRNSPGNLLVLNLAISDGLMMFEIPFFLYNTFNEGPALGEIGCLIYGFLGGLSGCASIITLTSISLDRFFVIRFPLNRKYSRLRVKISLLLVWIYAIFFSSIPLFDTEFGTYVPEGLLTSCSFDYMTENSKVKTFILTFFTAAWLLPMLVISFSYINIVKTVLLKTKGKMGNFKSNNESFRHVKEEEKNKQEIRLAFIIFFIIILWVISWTPYALVALFGIFNLKYLITPMSSMIPAMFCKTASCIDPFIYALFHTKFKRELKKIFCNSSTSSGDDETKIKRKEIKAAKKSQTKIHPNPSPMFDEDKFSNDDGVEIEFISVDYKKPPNWFYMPQNIEKFNELQYETNNCGSNWMFKPNFSNSSSSLRKFARRMSQKGSVKSHSSQNEED